MSVLIQRTDEVWRVVLGSIPTSIMCLILSRFIRALSRDTAFGPAVPNPRS